jgi:2-dehydropantoate 2-reductase
MAGRLSPVAVVGAGAVGGFYGAMLGRAGTQVTLIGRAAHMDAIARDGLKFETQGATHTIAIGAAHDIAAVAGARLVLFCVKSFDSDATARAMAPHLAPDAIVLSLQNGVDNVDRIQAQMPNPVLPVAVYTAAQIPAPGTVRHTGGGRLVIGVPARRKGPDRATLDAIAALFTKAGVPVQVSDDIDAEMWTKLVMNCAHNAISALGRARYGEMAAMPEIREVMRAAVRETMALAAAKGVILPESLVEATLKFGTTMPTTISSTAQDLRRGRRTEIDHLNGYVVRESEALGLATPVNRTLAALMKLVEREKME